MKKCDGLFKTQKKYLQFNDLNFQNNNEVSSASLSGGFKGETTEFSYGNGSYISFKNDELYTKEQKLSLTLTIDFSKFTYLTNQEKHYIDWLYMNIKKSGKIWAVQGDTLLWAWAYVREWTEPYEVNRETFEIDLDITLWEGFWHRANIYTTFAVESLDCEFTSCVEFLDPCSNLNKPCDWCSNEKKEERCQSYLCCNHLAKNDGICSIDKKLFYEECKNAYQIIEDCDAGKKLYGDLTREIKLCKECEDDSFISGRFYSHSVIKTEKYELSIVGPAKNPSIEINGNIMTIEGDYPYGMILDQSGEIIKVIDECGKTESVSPDKLKIEECHTFGFDIIHGWNSISVENEACCGADCMYIKTDDIVS